MNNILKEFPSTNELLSWYSDLNINNGKGVGNGAVPAVNAHIHSPYSFSAFADLKQAFSLASREGIKVLGINDFNTTKGYDAFYDLSREFNIFPLFNIEFMGLLEDEQREGIRINDPNNPGRIYFSGKGLDYPVSMGSGAREEIEKIISGSHRQVRAMTSKLSDHISAIQSGLRLDFDDIERRYTLGMVRERHVARALRELVFEKFSSEKEIAAFFAGLFGEEVSEADISDNAKLENIIRGKLLKAGGAAYVEEDPSAFLALDQVINIINDAGGIPCYPVLLDDAKGNFTEFESDLESLYKRLKSWGVSSVELIPGRNDQEELKRFVSFFSDRDFLILFGTEHNTPLLEPVTVSSRGGVALDDELNRVSYQGACVVAAHQYLRAKGEEGYVPFPGRDITDEFEELGNAVIRRFTDNR